MCEKSDPVTLLDGRGGGGENGVEDGFQDGSGESGFEEGRQRDWVDLGEIGAEVLGTALELLVGTFEFGP